MSLPSDLPAPEDDGAADRLPALEMPPVVPSGTAGSRVTLDDLRAAGAGRVPGLSSQSTGYPAEDGRIEHVFHPVLPPDRHAAEVLRWLRDHAGARA